VDRDAHRLLANDAGHVGGIAPLVLLMIAAPWRAALLDFLKAWPGEVLLERAAADPKRRALPIYELSWNHTTLHALKIDPTITYLQVLYPPPDHIQRALALHAQLGDEVMGHLELVRYDRQIAAFGLPIVRFTSEQRLDEIIRQHEDHGCPNFNPHAFTLEEGGIKQVDYSHLAWAGSRRRGASRPRPQRSACRSTITGRSAPRSAATSSSWCGCSRRSRRPTASARGRSTSAAQGLPCRTTSRPAPRCR